MNSTGTPLEAQFEDQRSSNSVWGLGKKPKMSPPKKFCLFASVRNESPVIVRLLDSLKHIIDFISITDTGSTDNSMIFKEDHIVADNIIK